MVGAAADENAALPADQDEFDLADDQAFTTQNLRSLRNCTLINMLDGCAISLPAHREGEVPVGLMLAASGGADRRIFELAAGMEGIIRV